MDEAEGRRKASKRLAAEAARRGWSPKRLALEAEVDEGTVRTFLKGERWAWETKRNAMEAALGLPVGITSLIAAGLVDDDDGDADPVVHAIDQSPLGRANKAKLKGYYYELLDSEEGGGEHDRSAAR